MGSFNLLNSNDGVGFDSDYDRWCTFFVIMHGNEGALLSSLVDVWCRSARSLYAYSSLFLLPVRALSAFL